MSSMQVTELRALASDVLHRAIRAPGFSRGSGDGVERAVCALCDQARDDDLRAEELVLAVKDVWRRLPEARRIPRDEGYRLLARVITLCITRFFADAWIDTPPRSQSLVRATESGVEPLRSHGA